MNQFNPTVIWGPGGGSGGIWSFRSGCKVVTLQVALLHHEVDLLRRIFRFTVGLDSRSSMSRTKG